MKKRTKGLLFTCAVGFSVLVLTGCTKSFCSVQDKAEQFAAYSEKHLESIDEKAEKEGLLLPQPAFITFIDQKVESYAALEECPKDSKGVPLLSFARFAGHDENGKQKLWANYDRWYLEAQEELGVDKVPGRSYIDYYKSSLKSGVGSNVACITPEDGEFGLAGNEVYIEGKTWGEAFRDYGPLEGLFVYPIGCMLHYFTKAFGVNGGGQVAAILLITVIIRSLVLLLTFPATLSQTRMSGLQPKMAELQQKYPNAATNVNDKQKLAQEQMKMYKDNHIHPFLQILFMFVQFPIFICVWSALQGSAILTQGTVFGLELTRLTSSAILSWSSETPFALILFLVMTLAQIFSTLLPQWLQKWKEKNLVTKVVKVQENPQQGSMKMMSYVMMGFIIIMGFTLPAAMAIYWFIGAIFSICQTIIIEAFQTRSRHRNGRNSSGGGQSWNRNKKDKKSDKFRIRKG